jgi:hypothetical protein
MTRPAQQPVSGANLAAAFPPRPQIHPKVACASTLAGDWTDPDEVADTCAPASGAADRHCKLPGWVWFVGLWCGRAASAVLLTLVFKVFMNVTLFAGRKQVTADDERVHLLRIARPAFLWCPV